MTRIRRQLKDIGMVFVLVLVVAPLLALAFIMAIVGKDGLWNDFRSMGGK